MSSTEVLENCPQVQVRFFTKQQQYAVADTPFSVPISVDTAALNNLVNSLLVDAGDGDTGAVEFDFLVNGEFLRQKLGDFLQDGSAQLTLESLIDVEYVQKSVPPEPQDSLAHDDWVSAVRTSSKYILSGCYDCTLHVWNLAGEHLLTIPGHTEAVKALDIVAEEVEGGGRDGCTTFVSASMDQSALVWKYSHRDNSVECVTVLQSHAKSVDCVSSQGRVGPLIATGSWDSDVHLWNPSVAAKPPAAGAGDRRLKKKKTVKKAAVHSPVQTLTDHKEAVSSLAWLSASELVSASWDHTIRLWDVEMGGMKTQLTGNKAFFDISCSASTGSVLAASADRHVRLYDPRSSEGSLVKATYTSHQGWVTGVAWSCSREREFVSCGHDMLVKHWDIRCPKAPLYDLEGHMDKVLDCDWSNHACIVSGSGDNTVKVFSVNK